VSGLAPFVIARARGDYRMDQFDKASKAKLSVQAHLELARRSRAGSLMHFVLFLVVATFSPYFKQHSAVILTVGCVLLAIGVARFVLASSFAGHYHNNPAFWMFIFRAGTYSAAVAWGAFSVLTMVLYGQEWVSWFVLVITTGIAAGANNSLSPDYALCRGYLLVLLGPTVALELIRGGLGGYPVAIVVGLYVGYLWIQGRHQSQSYWQAISQSMLLSLRTSELEERGAYLKALIDESPLAFVVVDPAHRVQMCNRAFERLFLFQQQEIIGKNINELLQTEALANEMIGFQRFAEMGNAVHARTSRRRKDGTLVSVEVHAVPLVLEKTFIGLCALYQDITERQCAEEKLKSAMRIKSDFISSATHQICLPLAGIKHLLDRAAQESKASQETTSPIRDARESVERLIGTVNHLLEVPDSKVEKAGARFQRQQPS
jgi:PAS domain S-box-containing protein